jgi:hypothetical protein
MASVVDLARAVDAGLLDDRLARKALRDLAFRFGPGWQARRRPDEVALLILGACAACSGGAVRPPNAAPDRMTTVVRVTDLACTLVGVDLGEQRL